MVKFISIKILIITLIAILIPLSCNKHNEISNGNIIQQEEEKLNPLANISKNILKNADIKWEQDYKNKYGSILYQQAYLKQINDTYRDAILVIPIKSKDLNNSNNLIISKHNGKHSFSIMRYFYSNSFKKKLLSLNSVKFEGFLKLESIKNGINLEYEYINGSRYTFHRKYIDKDNKSKNGEKRERDRLGYILRDIVVSANRGGGRSRVISRNTIPRPNPSTWGWQNPYGNNDRGNREKDYGRRRGGGGGGSTNKKPKTNKDKSIKLSPIVLSGDSNPPLNPGPDFPIPYPPISPWVLDIFSFPTPDGSNDKDNKKTGGKQDDNNKNNKKDKTDKIINKLTGKAKCVYDKLMKINGGFRNMIKKFDGDFPVAHLKFVLEVPENHKANASTVIPKDYIITIKINPNKLNRSNVTIAKTFIHEIIHAEMWRKVMSLINKGTIKRKHIKGEWKEKLSKGDYPGIFDYYTRYGINGFQHEQMAEHYINTMSNILQTFDKGQHSIGFYKDLSWNGLHETKIFKAKSNTEQKRLKDFWTNYRKNNKAESCD